MSQDDDGAYRVDVSMDVGEAVPFTYQRYQHLKRIEAGHIWWDDKWKTKRVVSKGRGSALLGADFDFAERLGLAYRTQQANKVGWFQYGLTTDGQILLERWKKGER